MFKRVTPRSRCSSASSTCVQSKISQRQFLVNRWFCSHGPARVQKLQLLGTLAETHISLTASAQALREKKKKRSFILFFCISFCDSVFFCIGSGGEFSGLSCKQCVRCHVVCGEGRGPNVRRSGRPTDNCVETRAWKRLPWLLLFFYRIERVITCADRFTDVADGLCLKCGEEGHSETARAGCSSQPSGSQSLTTERGMRAFRCSGTTGTSRVVAVHREREATKGSSTLVAVRTLAQAPVPRLQKVRERVRESVQRQGEGDGNSERHAFPQRKDSGRSEASRSDRSHEVQRRAHGHGPHLCLHDQWSVSGGMCRGEPVGDVSKTTKEKMGKVVSATQTPVLMSLPSASFVNSTCITPNRHDNGHMNTLSSSEEETFVATGRTGKR